MSGEDGVSKRLRRNFGKIDKIIEIPNLIEMQKHSYERFLQKDTSPEERQDFGLQGAFKSVFPIHDFAGTSSLEFVKYTFEEVKYDEEDCLNKGMTYETPLKLTVRLVVFDTDTVNGTKSIRDIKEQEIYFGTLPMMTQRGTFIINGTERVVVSQLHRSPGAFFDHDKGKTHSSGKLLYSARIIPYRGSWVEFEFDQKNILYVRIDRKRKFLASTFLRALGLSSDVDILREFYHPVTMRWEGKNLFRTLGRDMIGFRAIEDIKDPKGRKVLCPKGKKIVEGLYNQLVKAGIKEIKTDIETLEGALSIDEVINHETGEILIEANAEVTSGTVTVLSESGINSLEVFYPEREETGSIISQTLVKDNIKSQSDALIEIFHRRPFELSRKLALARQDEGD